MKASAFLTLTFLLTAIAGTNQISVSTIQEMNPKCGENVTLTCSIDKNVKVVQYFWTNGSRLLCDFKETTERVSPHVHCEYTDQDLKLTLEHVHPSNNGKYICILMASSDHGMNTTILHVSDCDVNASLVRNDKLTLNHACASDRKWINVLVSLTALLSFVLDSGV